MDNEEERCARPLGLGVRLVQVYYAATTAVGFLYGALINPYENLDYVYDLSMVRAIVLMATSVLAVWLIQKRRRLSIPFCIASTVACAVLSALDVFAFGAREIVFDCFGPAKMLVVVALEFVLAAVVVAYLAVAKAPREVLVEELDRTPEGKGNSWQYVPYKRRIRSWVFWRDISIYFITFSFLGHWAEMLFCKLILLGVFQGGYDASNAMLWDQWLFPFSAEGTALAMVALFLQPLANRMLRQLKGNRPLAIAISFVVTAVVCTAIDFGTGITCNQNFELWDYRDMPFNFMGQVCLQNSMVYSIAATIIVWVVYPAMDRKLRSIPKDHADMLFFGLGGFYLFEAALHFLSIGA